MHSGTLTIVSVPYFRFYNALGNSASDCSALPSSRFYDTLGGCVGQGKAGMGCAAFPILKPSPYTPKG